MSRQCARTRGDVHFSVYAQKGSAARHRYCRYDYDAVALCRQHIADITLLPFASASAALFFTRHADMLP